MLSRSFRILSLLIIMATISYGCTAGGAPQYRAAKAGLERVAFSGNSQLASCNNIALGKTANASLNTAQASLAIDGSTSTLWNARAYAPQWIEIDLGSPQTINELRMYTAQTPAGNTTHELWVAGSSKAYTKIDTLSGFTSDRQNLNRTFSPALTNVQWIKIVTTASPSWVAWFEIEVCQTQTSSTPTPTPTSPTSTPASTPTNTPVPPACNNIAVGKPVFATSNNAQAGGAVDGNLGTMWNARAFPPQSIEINLGSPQTVEELRMYSAQTPAGTTTHQMWVADASKNYTLVETTTAFTADRQLFRHPYNPALTNVQWVKITTTSSPSWVAWFEIQVCVPTVTPTPTSTGTITATFTPTNTPTGTATSTPAGPTPPPVCVNDVAIGKSVLASANQAQAAKAVDGNLGTMWNAMTFPPQWIEINLGSPQALAEIRMYSAQTPAGTTTHEVWVADGSKNYTLLDTTTAFTLDRQLFRHPVSSGQQIQWIKVITTKSPSWVAWFEIEACQSIATVTPTVTGTPIPPTDTPTFTPTSTATNTPVGPTPPPACVNDLAVGKPAFASANQAQAAKAVDGNLGTMWNAMAFSPQWIEVNLGSPQALAEIRMYSAQTPAGNTTHEVWVADASKTYTLLDTTTAFTLDRQLFRHSAEPTQQIQWIKVVTTSSPSWVAWFEIEACQFIATPTPTSTSTNTPITPTITATNTPTSTSTPTGTSTVVTSTPTPTSTGTITATSTSTPTSTAEVGQLKLCKESVSGIPKGQIFAIKVDTVSYNVPAGYCILAGTYPLNTNLTIQETIPVGYYVGGIEVLPSGRLVSRDTTIGQAVVKIGSGVTEVLYKNRLLSTPTPTQVDTSTPAPTSTPTATPSCGSDCTPTPTPIPTGRMQICKEADGAGVTGDFVFRYNSRSKTVPVGACSLINSVTAGTLTITEDARTGYAVSDIYTIPADRLVSKDITNRTATVTIVPGNAATQTIIVFVNRAVTTQSLSSSVPMTYSLLASHEDVGMNWPGLWEVSLGNNRTFQIVRIPAGY